MNLLDRITSYLGVKSKLDISARFEILREAVSGTMSNFFKVREHSTGRTLGLKILDPEKQKFFESRFEGLKRPSEGEIACSLKHPRIVETLEYGKTLNNETYVLMEFVEGQGLNTLVIDRSPLLEGNQLKLMRDMTEALQYVHEAGYIHRDICPRNFIALADCSECKLIDFGLTLPAKPEFMVPGNRTGTPNYMAPEIVRRRPTDQRVDIFALGVTFYRLLTFELPWPSGGGTGQDALAHDSNPPTDIFEYRPNLNPELGKLIMQCISKDPAKRPESAKELLKQLIRIRTVDKE